MAQLTYSQIEALWIANGGNPSLAPVMAAIAEAESGGNTTEINDNPRTGDYSVGLFQINYFDGLLGPRTQRYGSPAQMQNDPNAQARAAVDLAGPTGAGLSNWTTYKSAAYYQALNPNAPPDQTYAAALAAQGSGAKAGQLPNKCIITTPGSLPCLLNQSQARALVGGLVFGVGGLITLAGLAVLLKAAGLPAPGLQQIANATPAGRIASGLQRSTSGLTRATSGKRRPSPQSSASVEELDEELSLQRRSAEAAETARRAPRTSAGGRRMVGRSVPGPSSRAA